MVKFYSDSFISLFFAYLSVESFEMPLLFGADYFAGASVFILPKVDPLSILRPVSG